MRRKSKPSKQRSQDVQETEQVKEQQDGNHLMDKATLLSLPTARQLITIRDIHTRIVVDPKANFKHIESLFVYCKANEVKAVANALRTMSEVFVQVAPLQAVDLKRLQQRSEMTVTKEEYQVLRFESNLVDQYERYLKMLKELRSKLKQENFGEDREMFLEFRKCILQCVVTCYNTLWNFNHIKLLNALLFKFILEPEAKKIISSFLESTNIATLKLKAIIIAAVGELIKTKAEKVLPANLIALVNLTYIDTRYLKKDQEVLQFKKKKLTKKLYKQEAQEERKDRQRRAEKAESGTLQMKHRIKAEKAHQKTKVRQEVNRQFAEGEEHIGKKELVKGNSAILQELFYIYFKLLLKHTYTRFFSDSLVGVLNFAHLINIDLITSLIDHIVLASAAARDNWMSSKSFPMIRARLQLVFTCQSLLNGPLSVYSMDDLKATTSLFKIFRDIAVMPGKLPADCFKLIGQTLQECLLKRRQLSQEVVGSLVRQISILLLRKDTPKVYLLEILRIVASKYGKIGKMFEADNEGYGLNSFNAHCEDPQCSNAIHTSIIDNLQAILKLNNLKNSRKEVKAFVEQLARLNFNRIQGTLNTQELLEADIGMLGYECF